MSARRAPWVEALAVVADGEVYVVLPEHPWWVSHPKWIEGKPLVDGVIYASHTNEEWLTTDDLATWLEA